MSELNLRQRLLAVGAELSVAKTGQMSEGRERYSFIEYDKVMDSLEPLFNKHGVHVRPEITEVLSQADIESRSGTKGRHYVLKLRYTFENAADPSDHFTIEWVGEARDYGDKGVQKAASLGEKYMYLKVLKAAPGDGNLDEERQEAVVSGSRSVTTSEHGTQTAPITRGGGAPAGEPSEAELAKLVALAATMPKPVAEPVLKARLRQFGYEATVKALVEQGAKVEVEVVPAEPASNGEAA